MSSALRDTARIYLATLCYAEMMEVEEYFSSAYTQSLREMLEYADRAQWFQHIPLWTPALAAFRAMPDELPRCVDEGKKKKAEQDSAEFGEPDPDDPLHRFTRGSPTKEVYRIVAALLFAMYPVAVGPISPQVSVIHAESLCDLFQNAALHDQLTLVQPHKWRDVRKKPFTFGEQYAYHTTILHGMQDWVATNVKTYWEVTSPSMITPKYFWYGGRRFSYSHFELFAAATAAPLGGPPDKREAVPAMSHEWRQARENMQAVMEAVQEARLERKRAQQEYKIVQHQLSVCKRKAEFGETAIKVAELEERRIKRRMKSYGVTETDLRKAITMEPGGQEYLDAQAAFFNGHVMEAKGDDD